MKIPPVFTPVLLGSLAYLELDLLNDSDASGWWYCDIPGWFIKVPAAMIRIPLEKLRHAVSVATANEGLFTTVSIQASIDCPGFDGKVTRAQIKIDCSKGDYRDMTAVFRDDESGAEMSFDLIGFWPDSIDANGFIYYLKSI
ncbi:hypothetical protein [Neisseria canis]|uniref:Uncharacterized protein n=1 Tax=Neisseria canis TaxID=493 RepID=A0A1X3CZ88_9NEIS|nr:hypothetical protein [Neisseria canis]OSI12980.1 hypothetical protein BWD07_02600 [Neisseria canis]VEF02442.1 Uncharacterised protein [Neisseria canis]